MDVRGDRRRHEAVGVSALARTPANGGRGHVGRGSVHEQNRRHGWDYRSPIILEARTGNS